MAWYQPKKIVHLTGTIPLKWLALCPVSSLMCWPLNTPIADVAGTAWHEAIRLSQLAKEKLSLWITELDKFKQISNGWILALQGWVGFS